MRATHPHNTTTHNNPNKRINTSLFSCAFFCHCTESPLSPTTPPSPSPPPLRPPLHQSNKIASPLPCPPLCPQSGKSSESESSSSSTSQSFTQWRFPPTFPHQPRNLSLPVRPEGARNDGLEGNIDLVEVFQLAESCFVSGSDSDCFQALQILEQSIVPNPPSDVVSEGEAKIVVPPVVVDGVVREMTRPTLAKSATKVLLALCLAEGNRVVVVECGAPTRVLDALPDLNGSVAERALAALELMCTVHEGGAQVRAHALAVPMLVATMGKMEGRGREYAISVLTAVYGGASEDHHVWEVAPPEEVARAVVLAMQQGECSARGKRKGAQLLKILQENGKVDLTQ